MSWSSIRRTVGSPEESLETTEKETVEPNKTIQKRDRHWTYPWPLSASIV